MFICMKLIIFGLFLFQRAAAQEEAIGTLDGRNLNFQVRLLDAKSTRESSAEVRSDLSKLTISVEHLNELFGNSTLNRTFNRVSFCNVKNKPKFLLHRGSLLAYMMRLKICSFVTNKTWFEDECRDPTVAYSDYYKAVYLKFCNPNKFELQCRTKVDQNPTSALLYWINKHNIVWSINNVNKLNRLPMNDSLESLITSASNVQSAHCKAINSFFDSILPQSQIISNGYSSENLTWELAMPFYNVQYAEWFLRYKAFCRPSACGISRQDYNNHSITAYECLSSDCKAPIIATIVIDGVLAALIVISNFLVLAVAWRTTIMHNIPGYFKISLAIADLIVGLVVLPGSVYHGFVQNLRPLPIRAEGQMPRVTDFFDQGYLNFVGVFTVWSFSVSVLTLGAASIDRYLAVTRPFKYKQGKYLTKKRSIAVFIILWTFGFTISIYPIFTNYFYTLSALGLVLSTGPLAIILYAISLGLPLFSVWAINLALLGHVCSDRKSRRKLSVNRRKISSGTEWNQQKSKLSVASISLKRHSSNLNDDVFESETHANNNEEFVLNEQHQAKPVIRAREERESESNPRNRMSQITTTMRLKFKNRMSQTSTKSFATPANVERRLAKTLGVMIGAFTLALLPSIVVLGIQPALDMFITPGNHPKTYSEDVTYTYTSAEYVATRLFLSNAFWNCIIYSVRNRHFREAIVDVFICDEDKRRKRRNTIVTYSNSKTQPDNRHIARSASIGNGARLSK